MTHAKDFLAVRYEDADIWIMSLISIIKMERPVNQTASLQQPWEVGVHIEVQ